MTNLTKWAGAGLSFIVIALANAGAQSSQQLPARPNVVVIMMDDLGYGDLSSYGAPDARTPNIDRLANEGVRFTDAYANGAVCTPTRAALMTGRYQQRIGLEWALGSAGLDLSRGLPATPASLPAVLRGAGYSTGLIGKWHLGTRPEFGPNAHGFDEFFGFLGGAIDSYTHVGMDGKSDLYENSRPVQIKGYLTDELTTRAVSFIERQSAKPFFLEVAYNATHWPFQPPDAPPTPGAAASSTLYEIPGDPAAHTRRDYVQMLERADQGVGQILKALEQKGLTQNTLVIFTNDNGGEWLSRSAPFFSRKGTLWEGGIRVPLIMKWPAQIPRAKTSTQVAMTMDVTATVLSAAQIRSSTPDALDGIDLISSARGAAPASRALFWRIGQPTRVQRAVRSGDWKLLIEGRSVQDGVHVMLFDLKVDPGERNDLAARHPAVVADLRARHAAWEIDVASR